MGARKRCVVSFSTKQTAQQISSKSKTFHQTSKIWFYFLNFQNFENQRFQTLQTQKWKNCQSSAKKLTQKWKFDKMEIWPRFYSTPSQKWNSILSGMYCRLHTVYYPLCAVCLAINLIVLPLYKALSYRRSTVTMLLIRETFWFELETWNLQ